MKPPIVESRKDILDTLELINVRFASRFFTTPYRLLQSMAWRCAWEDERLKLIASGLKPNNKRCKECKQRMREWREYGEGK